MHCHIAVGSQVLDIHGNQQEFDLSESQCAMLKPGGLLGQGNYGSAYEVDGDPEKVVKFTVDPADAKAAARLVGKRVSGAVKVFKVAALKGRKTYGDVPVAFYDAEQDDFVDAEGPQPVFAIVAERLKPLSSNYHKVALDNLNGRGVRGNRQELSRMDPKTFRFPKPYRDRAVDYCERAWISRDECEGYIDEAVESMEDVAHKAGVIPLDVHGENWGRRKSGKLALLDLGVSTGAEDERPDALAGADTTTLNVAVAFGIGLALWLALRR